MCNCIQRIEEDVKNNHNAHMAFMEHSGKASEVAYTPYTAKGNVSAHRRYLHIPWKYCPFCGKKIKI